MIFPSTFYLSHKVSLLKVLKFYLVGLENDHFDIRFPGIILLFSYVFMRESFKIIGIKWVAYHISIKSNKTGSRHNKIVPKD